MQNELRLKKRQDFRKVYNRGKSFANRELVIFVMNNNDVDRLRIGISVSKKIGKAVIRNKVKRSIKESFRVILDRYSLKNNIDIVIIARTPTATMDFNHFQRSLIDLLKKAKLISRTKD